MAPPLLPLRSQSTSPPLPSLELIATRTRHGQDGAAGKPQAAADYGFDRSDLT